MKIDVPSKQIMIFIMSPSNLSKVYPCSMYLCGRGFYCCVGFPRPLASSQLAKTSPREG